MEKQRKTAVSPFLDLGPKNTPHQEADLQAASSTQLQQETTTGFLSLFQFQGNVLSKTAKKVAWKI